MFKYIELHYKVLPIVYKLRFEDINELLGVFIDDAEEYKLSNDTYFIDIKKFTIMEKYSTGNVLNSGRLRVIFNNCFKITHWEYESYSHVETGNENEHIVNEFGITPTYSRSLIIAESMTKILSSTAHDQEINKT